MPSDNRLTPAARKARKFSASAELGLASRVISTPGANPNARAAVARTAATVSGLMRDGVPPPKNTLVSGPVPDSAAAPSTEATRAARQRPSSIESRTWLLKSQYGHFEAQNGQCT